MKGNRLIRGDKKSSLRTFHDVSSAEGVAHLWRLLNVNSNMMKFRHLAFGGSARPGMISGCRGTSAE